MSIRRFNYTERQRLVREDLAIYLVDQGPSKAFDATFDLSDYDLPPDARVIVEAYRQTTVRRYGFGRVADPRADDSTVLDDFADTSGVLFRVKVVDAAGSGRLLAAADSLHASELEAGDRRSLVRVADADLGGEFWGLSFDAGGPVLVLEKKYAREALLSSPHFKCLVLPQVFRELLRRALEEWDEDNDDESGWSSRVVIFAERLCGKAAPEDDEEDEREYWITTAVRAFCRRHGFSRKYADEVVGGGTQL